jgi:hypothetical protein
MIKDKKIKFFIMLGVILFSLISITGCKESRISTEMFSNSEYNAVLIAQPIGLSSRISDLEIKFNDDELYFRDKNLGCPIKGNVNKTNWMNKEKYEFYLNGDFDFLFKNNECLEIMFEYEFHGSNYFAFIVNGDDKYLLHGVKSNLYTEIIRVYKLNKIN